MWFVFLCLGISLSTVLSFYLILSIWNKEGYAALAEDGYGKGRRGKTEGKWCNYILEKYGHLILFKEYYFNYTQIPFKTSCALSHWTIPPASETTI